MDMNSATSSDLPGGVGRISSLKSLVSPPSSGRPVEIRADEQRQRERKLRDDQQVAQSPPAGNFRASTASAFERLAQIGIDVIESGHKTEEETTDHSAERGTPEHEAVHPRSEEHT